MRVIYGKSFKGGWFIGNFEPTIYKTDQFEVCYKVHEKDEVWDVHFHKGIEINYLMHGEMIIQGKKLNAGDVFVLDPYEISDAKFLKRCEIIVVKIPSDPSDKYILEDDHGNFYKA